MGVPAGFRHPLAFCPECGGIKSLRADGTLYRHSIDDQLCAGSQMVPSEMMLDGEIQPFDLNKFRPKPIDEPSVPGEDSPAYTDYEDPINQPIVFGREYPIITEAGIVIGRGRVDVGKIVILGPKWIERTG